MTRTLLITYDLRGHETSSDYTRLIEEIKGYEEALHPLYSVWLVRSSWTAAEVRDDLVPHIDEDDRLLVWDVSGKGASWEGLATEASAWIQATP